MLNAESNNLEILRLLRISLRRQAKQAQEKIANDETFLDVCNENFSCIDTKG